MSALTLLTAVASGVALLLIWLLFWRLWTLNQVSRLHHVRSTGLGFADLLSYASVVDDGIIVHKNGAFSAAWGYEAPDSASLSEREYEALCGHLNQALKSLGAGWMLHVDVIRANTEAIIRSGQFGDPLSAAIDRERREYFAKHGTLYECTYVLTVTWFPPVLAERKFVALFFETEDAAPVSSNPRAQSRELLNQFKRSLDQLRSRLSTGFELHRLQAEPHESLIYDSFLGHLNRCITGLNHPVQLPPTPIYLDALLGSQELWTGLSPRLGKEYIQVIAIEGFPTHSTPGMLQILTELPCEYRWSTRFIPLDEHEALKHLHKFRRNWRQQVRGFFDYIFGLGTGPVNQDAMQMVAETEEAIGHVHSGHVAYGYYTSVVILRDEDLEVLDQLGKYVAKQINRLGFVCRIETVNTVEALLGSFPGEGHANVRRPLIHTVNLADLLPTSSIWAGSASAPCPLYPENSPPLMQVIAEGSTPFRLNLHVGDVGHTLMIGPTGSGKSTHLALLAAQFRRYPNISIYCFDKGQSMYCLASGIRAITRGRTGQHFEIAADEATLAFCPLQFLSTADDKAWAVEWLETILSLNGVKIPPERRNTIAHAIQNMSESGGKTLSDFVMAVQDQSVREALHAYTIDGPMGYLLDATQDGLALSDFSVFEIEHLMNLGERYALPVLLYLFRRVQRALNGQPAVILLDEAWVMLGHPTFRDKIREWLKVLRKENCLVVLATQSLTDAEQSGIFDVLLESCPTKILLPNPHALDDHTVDIYRRMGLHDHQIAAIAEARPKRDYYYTSPQGKRLYQLALGPLALALTSTSDKESLQEIKRLERSMGPSWLKYWLSERGIHPVPAEDLP